MPEQIMNRSLALLSSAALLAVSASAQCFTATGTSIVPIMAPTGGFAVDDEGRSSDILLPFTFAMGGTNWSHIVVESNGEIYLTDGTGVVNPALFGIDGIAEMRGGGAGGSPRITAFGGDAQGIAGLVGWDILLDDTVAGQVKVTWTHMRFFAGTGQDYSMSVTLFNGGAVQFDYDVGNFGVPNTGDFAGLSIGNNVGTGNELSSFLDNAGTSGTLGMVYQNAWNPWNLDDESILLAPNGSGGYDWAVICGLPSNPPAANVNFGTGCYDNSSFASVFQSWTNLQDADAALQGQTLMYVPNGLGYTMLQGAGTFRPTTTATILTLADDVEMAMPLTTPFNYLGTTPIGTVYLSSNGFVSMGAGNNTIDFNNNTYYDDAGDAAFVAYGEDLDPDSGNAGVCSWEEDSGVVYFTWEAVPHWPGGATDGAVTFQIQMDVASGIVTVVYGTMDPGTQTDDASVGYTITGPLALWNGINIATDLPYATTATDVVSPAMTMSASPAPISTVGSGSLVDFTVNNAPDFGGATPIGLNVGLVIWSTAPSSLPLMVLDPTAGPDCTIYVASLDASAGFVGPVGPQTVTFTLPAGVPYGVELFAQGVALSTGINQFLGGVALSNGVRMVISDN